MPATGQVGGKMVALKAAKAEDELKDAKSAIQLLGGQISADDEFALPISEEKRHIIVIDKVKDTPKSIRESLEHQAKNHWIKSNDKGG